MTYKNLETAFNQSNYVLFDGAVNSIETKEIKEIMISRVNLARSIKITDNSNSEFDKLLNSLEYSIENSDDIMALSLISKLNQTLISVADSFDNISSVIKKIKK